MSYPVIHNEKVLLERIAEGDERAFEELYNIYTPRLRPYLWKTTRSGADTEEILQETFIRIWLHRDRLPGMENPGGFIFRTAARTSLNFMRASLTRIKKIEELGLTGEAANAQMETPLDLMQVEAIQRTIREGVEQLSPQQKRIYLLNREEGLKPSVIAQQLQLSISTVKNHLSDALRQLRIHLATAGYDVALVGSVLAYFTC